MTHSRISICLKGLIVERINMFERTQSRISICLKGLIAELVYV